MKKEYANLSNYLDTLKLIQQNSIRMLDTVKPFML